jgi:hypothetical protein
VLWLSACAQEAEHRGATTLTARLLASATDEEQATCVCSCTKPHDIPTRFRVCSIVHCNPSAALNETQPSKAKEQAHKKACPETQLMLQFTINRKRSWCSAAMLLKVQWRLAAQQHQSGQDNERLLTAELIHLCQTGPIKQRPRKVRCTMPPWRAATLRKQP